MKKAVWIIAGVCFVLSACTNEAPKEENNLSEEVETYLSSYNEKFQQLLIESAEYEWKLNTMIKEGDTLTAALADEAKEKMAKFTGSKANIDNARRFLEQKDKLTPLQVRQLQTILYNAGSNPETAGDVVKERIAAETQQTKDLFGFDFQLNGKSVTTNDIDRMLKTSNDLKTRQAAWEASKEVGIPLKPGLEKLRKLRNQSVQALGYDDFFAYQVSDYGMTTQELRKVCNDMVKELWPLYRELHTWARYTLAEKYKSEVPEYLPAHWLPNRWGQDWSALVKVEGLDLDPVLAEKSAEWIVEEGEQFYVSLGFDTLPASFYEKSSLYPLPPDADYKKNNHASAWHMDNDKDVRSLMSIEPNTEWWGTTLHELGHIYYYMTYSNPDVPIILRGGANRAYHEAMGSLMGLAALQKPFLKHIGLMPENDNNDNAELALLKEALEFVVLIPWGAGVMTEFEHALYADELPVNEFNSKWWELKKQYQGIVPPGERGETYCDAASKTHINDDPAQYYDYAMSNILLFQFHVHIAQQLLHQDPHATNYYGNKAVGDFLKKLMYPGASVDWRKHLKENIGEDMSARAMVNYFEPLMTYLQKENEGRTHTLPKSF
jgi:peptidyl-dipeptidase A